MTRAELEAYIAEVYSVDGEHPFAAYPDYAVFRHDSNRKWFAVAMSIPRLDAAAVTRAIKIGACNIYHGCVHNMLHEKSEEILRGLYKSASFVVQAIYFQESGNYVSRQRDMLSVVLEDERVIVETFLSLKKGGAVDFGAMSETLFVWAQKWIG